jgi:hypothetical protein
MLLEMSDFCCIVKETANCKVISTEGSVAVCSWPHTPNNISTINRFE